MKVKVWLYTNWGDLANYELIKLMTGKAPELVKADVSVDEENYLCLGSVLRFADKNSIVWGAGYLSSFDVVGAPPKKICAVRGPLTRQALITQGLDCPEVYGDPALLLPRYYHPTIEKKHKRGLVLHWSSRYLSTHKPDEYHPVYADMPFYEFIDNILSCEQIFSTSLHGIIVADAYGIPAEQIGAPAEPYQFKFDDYYASRDKVNLDLLEKACPFLH